MLSDFRHDCLTSKTDRKGQTIQYVYDALNRLTHKGYPDTTGVDYIYDLAGKIKQVSDPTGTYGFAYDNMGRLIGTTTQYAFLPGVTYSNSYGYDAASNRTSFTAPDGSAVNYGYDTLGRLTNLTDSATGQFTFGYDILSRRTSLNRPNGVNTSYSYDSLSRLLSVLHQAGTVTLDGDSYTYDNAGNRLTKVNSLNNITENYTYDAIYQLTQVTQGLTTSESYSYDSVGNRLSSQGMSPYAYNSSNQLTSAPSATFTYDGNGNTSAKADTNGTTTYTWDFENRLISVALPGTGGTVTFKYDPFGRRIQKSSSSGTTNYLYDGRNSVEELDQTGAELAHYSQGAGIDEPLAALRGGIDGFYEQDGLGSVTTLTDSTGAILNSYTYDSFGNLTASTGSFLNPYQYTGRDYDPETGLRYYRARYYDSASARFLNEDPIRFFGGGNFYSYTRNNPLYFIDSLGLAPAAVLVPSKYVPGSKLEGDLDPLCRDGRDKVRDAAMLLESISTREAEIEYYLNSDKPWIRDLAEDPGHILRIELEEMTLERCKECDNDKKPEPNEEPVLSWKKVKESVKKHKAEYGVLGGLAVVGAAVALAPETGGASLAGLAFAF